MSGGDLEIRAAEVRKILVILPRQLGDILLGTPLAHALRERYPHATLSWYAHPMGKLLLDGHPWVDHLLCYPTPAKQSPGTRPRLLERLRAVWSLVRAEWNFIRRLRAERFDLVVDAMNNPRTALAAFLTGAPVRLSFRTRFPRNLAFHRLAAAEKLGEGYVARARLALLEPLGIPPDGDCSALLPILQGERARVDSLLDEHGLRGERFVVMAPAHRHAVRKWPGRNFVELALRIFNETGLSTVWLWGPGEEAEVGGLHAALREANPGASVFPPLLNLRETAYLSGKSACFIGNSNGLSHVAVAGGARSVQLHGPTDPENWTFPDASRHLGLRRASGCVGCEKNICSLARRECLDDLAVEDVYFGFKRIFAGS